MSSGWRERKESVHCPRVGSACNAVQRREERTNRQQKDGDSAPAGPKRRSSLSPSDGGWLPDSRALCSHVVVAHCSLHLAAIPLPSSPCCSCDPPQPSLPPSPPLRSAAMATIKPNNRVFVYDSQQRAQITNMATGDWSEMVQVSDVRGPTLTVIAGAALFCPALSALPVLCATLCSVCSVPLSLLCVTLFVLFVSCCQRRRRHDQVREARQQGLGLPRHGQRGCDQGAGRCRNPVRGGRAGVRWLCLWRQYLRQVEHSTLPLLLPLLLPLSCRPSRSACLASIPILRR